MKKLFTATLLLLCIAAVQSFGATKWQFVKIWPDTNLINPRLDGLGLHGIAVDPNGRIWFQYYGTSDSVFDVVQNAWRYVRVINVYNQDGTKAPFSPIKTVTVGGKTDTLYNSNRGIRADKSGNIVFASFDTYYKLDYKTGAGLAKVTPYSGATAVQPAFDDANEMFAGLVIGGGGLKFFDGSFNLLGNVDTVSDGVCRTIEVSGDGNTVYYTFYGGVYLYKSPDHSLLPFTPKADSLGMGLAAEVAEWNKKDGYIYIGGGSEINPTTGGWSLRTIYAFDPVTKAVKDSIKWDMSAYHYNTSDGPRPRGLAFSNSGDTAYFCAFNLAGGANGGIQMFRRVLVSVEQVDNLIPNGYELSQNYPNPFNPSTEIRFTVAHSGFTTIKVYNVLGEEVATLVNENLGAGSYKTTFEAGKLSSGTYIYTLTSGDTHISKKMLLVK
jgi:hypothetical protein